MGVLVVVKCIPFEWLGIGHSDFLSPLLNRFSFTPNIISFILVTFRLWRKMTCITWIINFCQIITVICTEGSPRDVAQNFKYYLEFHPWVPQPCAMNQLGIGRCSSNLWFLSNRAVHLTRRLVEMFALSVALNDRFYRVTNRLLLMLIDVINGILSLSKFENFTFPSC